MFKQLEVSRDNPGRLAQTGHKHSAVLLVPPVIRLASLAPVTRLFEQLEH